MRTGSDTTRIPEPRVVARPRIRRRVLPLRVSIHGVDIELDSVYGVIVRSGCLQGNRVRDRRTVRRVLPRRRGSEVVHGDGMLVPCACPDAIVLRDVQNPWAIAGRRPAPTEFIAYRSRDGGHQSPVHPELDLWRNFWMFDGG